MQNEVFDLLVQLDAPEYALDFLVVYASARDGWATLDRSKLTVETRPSNMLDLYRTIVDTIPAPYAPGSSRGAAAGYASMEAALAHPLQLMVTSILYSDFVGRIAVGRVTAGTIRPGMPVILVARDGTQKKQKVLELESFEGLKRVKTQEAHAGDVVAVIGVEGIEIGATITDAENPVPMPPIAIDEPTVTMSFRVNDSPFAGREGKFVTGRQIGDRLIKELEKNVALRVERTEGNESYKVSGRGLMHLGVLIETMRREGFEVQVSKPEVILREIDGKTCEPVEELAVDCPEENQSDVMSLVLSRKGELQTMQAKTGASGWTHMEFKIPSRALFGLRTQMLTATRGEAMMHHTLCGYEPVKGAPPRRSNGVMIAAGTGEVTSYSLDRLYDRGDFFSKPGDAIYEGQLVGEHCKDNDLGVNLDIAKKLSNVRASGSDDAAKVKPARQMSLENCLEYIEADELVEITPLSIRMRKRFLKETDRKRYEKQFFQGA